MERTDEINEVALLINSLCKKYNVALNVTINDLSLKDQKMSEDTQEQQAEQVAPEAPTTPVEPAAEVEPAADVA